MAHPLQLPTSATLQFSLNERVAYTRSDGTESTGTIAEACAFWNPPCDPRAIHVEPLVLYIIADDDPNGKRDAISETNVRDLRNG